MSNQAAQPTLQRSLEVLRVSLLKQEDELAMLRGTVQRQRTDVVRLLQQRQKADEATKIVSTSLRKLSDEHAEYSEKLERDLEVARQELANEKEKALAMGGGASSLLMGSASMRRMRSNVSGRSGRRSGSRQDLGREGSVRSMSGGGLDETTQSLPRKRRSQGPKQGEDVQCEDVTLAIPAIGGDEEEQQQQQQQQHDTREIDGPTPPMDDDLIGSIQAVESDWDEDETDFSDEWDEDEEEEEVVPASYAVELEQKLAELQQENQVKDELIQAFAQEKEKSRQHEDKWKATEEEANLHRKLIYQEVEHKYSTQLKDTIRIAEENQRAAESKVATLLKDLRVINQENGVLSHRVRLAEERQAIATQQAALHSPSSVNQPVHVQSVACSTDMPTPSVPSKDGHHVSPVASACWFKDAAVQSDLSEAAVVYLEEGSGEEVGGRSVSIGTGAGATSGVSFAGEDDQARKYQEAEGLKTLVRELESELEQTRRRLAEEARERAQLEWRVERRDAQYTTNQQELRTMKQQLDAKSNAVSVDSSVQQLRLAAQLEEAQQSATKLSAKNDAANSEVQLAQAEVKNLQVVLSGREAKLSSLEAQLEESTVRQEQLLGEKFTLAERMEVAEHHEKQYKSQLALEAEDTDRLRKKLSAVERDRDESESRLRAEVMDLAGKLREKKESSIATNYKAQRNTVSFLAFEAAQDERDRLRRTLRDTHSVLRNVMEQVGLESALESCSGGAASTAAGGAGSPSGKGSVIAGSSPPPKQPQGTASRGAKSSSPSYAPRKSIDPTSTPIDGDLLIKDVKSLHFYFAANSNKQQHHQ